MDLHGGRVLGARLSGALARIAADRFEEILGRALPRTPVQLAQPHALNDLLAHHRAAGMRLPAVSSARLPGIEFESSNCTNFLVELEFAREEDTREPLPRTVYAKLPCPEIATRAFANAVGFWEVEVAFCRRLASRVPIRVPRVYAAAKRGARFVLVLENLQELPGVRLFDNRDMAAGTTLERARQCLRMFAQLHAGFAAIPPDAQERLLPRRLHPYLAPGGRALTRALNDAAIGPAHRAAPEILRKEHVAAYREAIRKWDVLIDTWYGGPLTLVHGDSHLANCFEYTTPEGPRMGMLDFQGAHWCKGIRDVQYFLINSLEPELLAGHEESLVACYVEALREHGITLGLQEAHEQYRAFSFQTWMVAVTSLGLGSLTERDTTVRTVLRRSVAAIERLGVADWVAAL